MPFPSGAFGTAVAEGEERADEQDVDSASARFIISDLSDIFISDIFILPVH